jgi:predicted nuclease of restriction endonuclease-like (RecB) superfamily
VPGIYTNTAQIGNRIRLKGDIQRDFYAEMGRIERWSVWTLREKIDGMLMNEPLYPISLKKRKSR